MSTKIEIQLPTEEQKAMIRQQMGTSVEDIRQSVAVCRNWLLAQPHLPHVIGDDRLERMYLNCKCRIEKLKKVLDAYYTLKTKFPEILTNRDLLSDNFSEVFKYGKLFIMPRLTPECNRVIILTDVASDVKNWKMVDTIKGSLMGLEYLLSFDYCVGLIIVFDLKNVTSAHIAKLSINLLRALDIICRKAYAHRVVSMHYVNAPTIVDLFLTVIKPATPEKLQKRIVTHLPGSETLFEYLPKNMVNNELGGSGGPADELQNATLDRLIEHRDWFLEEDKYIADEDKRPTDNEFEYNLFGIDGSFKKLQVD